MGESATPGCLAKTVKICFNFTYERQFIFVAFFPFRQKLPFSVSKAAAAQSIPFKEVRMKRNRKQEIGALAAG